MSVAPRVVRDLLLQELAYCVYRAHAATRSLCIAIDCEVILRRSVSIRRAGGDAAVITVDTERKSRGPRTTSQIIARPARISRQLVVIHQL